jgi:segregation and condensation protein A
VNSLRAKRSEFVDKSICTRSYILGYEVKLDVFEGPVDLLLQLITKQRVDIYDVSIATITEEYQEAVAERRDLDLEAATGFLVVAATLLELKSVRLLPSPRLDEADVQLLEERDLLLARLVEVSTYREAGAWIAVGLHRGRQIFARSVVLEPRFAGLAPDPLATVGPGDVARAGARAFAPRPGLALDTSHITPITASVKDAILDVARAFLTVRTISFESLCRGLTNRIDIVVRFLALLELSKAGALELSQAERFGEITAIWTGEVEADEVAREAEEYSLRSAPPSGTSQRAAEASTSSTLSPSGPNGSNRNQVAGPSPTESVAGIGPNTSREREIGEA